MITVASCFSIEEARSLQMALTAANVPSFIPDEATAQNAPYFFIGSGAGVRLQVAEEHEEEARQVIGDARPISSDDDKKDGEKEKVAENEEEQRF